MAAASALCVAIRTVAPKRGGLAEQGEHLIAAGGVEVAGGFVGDEQVGRVNQRACDRHALHLSAGKLVRHAGGLFREPYPMQALARRLGGLGGARKQQGQFDILQHGQRGQQLKGLEDEPHAFAAQGCELAVRKGRGGAAVDQDFARGRKVHGARQVEQGALTAAAAAHQRSHGAGFGGQRNGMQNLHRLASVGVRFVYFAEFQARGKHVQSDHSAPGRFLH